MASSKAECMVKVMVEDNESLAKTYQMSPHNTLSELLKIWKDDFQLSDHWIFLSVSGDNPFDDDCMSLEMLRQSSQKTNMITLKAVLFEDYVNEIFIHYNGECHHIKVKPSQKLFELTQRLSDRPIALEYNGVPLNLNNSIKQAGIKNKAVIFEIRRLITVKLSTGIIVSIRVPSGSIVSELIEEVKVYESDDFSLAYQGRLLHPQETIRGLFQVVQVITAKFIVQINNQRVIWSTKYEPITFSEFLTQLAFKGKMNRKNLETMNFYCNGCKRCISNSKKVVQIMPLECCEEKSMILTAIPAFDFETDSKTDDENRCIQTFYDQLVNYTVNDRRGEVPRIMCRQMKDKFSELNYNIILQLSKGMTKDICDREDTIKNLMLDIETLRKKNEILEIEIKRILTVYVQSTEQPNERNDENQKSSDKSKKPSDSKSLLRKKKRKSRDESMDYEKELKKLKDNDRKSQNENMRLEEKINVLQDKNRKLMEERTMNIEKSKKLKEQNKQLKEECIRCTNEINEKKNTNRMLKEEKAKSTEKIKILKDEIKRLKAVKYVFSSRRSLQEEVINPLSLPRASISSFGNHGVKLLVFYSEDDFSPVSRPEIKHRGRYVHSPPFIKCDTLSLCPGMTPFEDVRNSLKQFFTGRDFRVILQLRGFVSGTEVTEVTDGDGDEVDEECKKPFSSVDGCERYLWGEVEKPWWNRIGPDGMVLLSGEHQRTVLMISRY